MASRLLAQCSFHCFSFRLALSCSLSSLADPPGSRQWGWVSGVTQSPAHRFPHLPWPRSFPWQTALGLLGCCVSEKRSSLAEQIQPRRKATPCKIAPGPQRRVFLVFSLTFSSGLKPRMCPVFSSLVPPHRPPHPWCLQFPEC